MTALRGIEAADIVADLRVDRAEIEGLSAEKRILIKRRDLPHLRFQQRQIFIRPVNAVSVGDRRGHIAEAELIQIFHRIRKLRDSLRRDRHQRIGSRHIFQQQLCLFLHNAECPAAVCKDAAAVLRRALKGQPDADFYAARECQKGFGQQRAVRGHLIENRNAGLFGFCGTPADGAVDQRHFKQRLSAEKAKSRRSSG